MTFVIPGYEPTERTRFKLVIARDEGGPPRAVLTPPAEALADPEAQIETLQRLYMAERDASGEGVSTFGEGRLYDEAGQFLGRVSYNGRLWDAGPWIPGAPYLRAAPGPAPAAATALPVTPWTNCGDIDPRQGAVFFRLGEARLDDRDFTVPALEVIPETHVGGSDKVFDLRQGTVHLARRDFADALATVGATLEDDTIVRDGHDGNEELIVLSSSEGLRALAEAIHAYGGIQDVDASVLVSIGLPDHLDQTRKFTGETVYYPADASIWAVIRDRLDDSMFSPAECAGRTPAEATPFPDDLLEGMPQDIGTRADLAGMKAFASLGTDSDGNPCVWRNHYRDDDGREWEDEWSCQCDDDGWEPVESDWIGPEHPALVELWNDLPDRGDPSAEKRAEAEDDSLEP